jgi:hypothetical protein
MTTEVIHRSEAAGPHRIDVTRTLLPSMQDIMGVHKGLMFALLLQTNY